MAEIGSFALILALALSVYSFLAGIVALSFQRQLQPAGSSVPRSARISASLGGSFAAMLRRASERLGETAPRAAIATFAFVFLASLILVTCAFPSHSSIA